MNRMTNSHLLAHPFAFVQPASLEEAVAVLSQHGHQARALAGGTDLLVQMKMERVLPQYVVHIRHLRELNDITLTDTELRLGSCVTIRRLRQSLPVRALYAALAQGCASFSTTQIQFMGTIGGNICNGSPASDTAPALIAFGAQAVVKGPQGERQLPLEEIFLGPGRISLRQGELLTAISLPRPRPGTGSAFLKVSRLAADLAKANVAAVVVRDGDRIADCRLVFGSVGPTPVRAREAEALLVGQVWSDEAALGAAKRASQEIAPIDDVRSTAEYRREVARVLGYDGLRRAWESAASEQDVGPTEVAGKVGELDPGAPEQRHSAGFTIAPDAQREITLTVNGVRRSLGVAPNELLLDVLRDRLLLTGAKYVCGIGECGACTVELDGQPVLACLTLAASVADRSIVTVEGLEKPDGTVDPLQEAFIEHAAFQCGYCTPGMLMTAKSLLMENACPSEEEVRDYMKGNLCRCTGYASIVRAVMSCAGVRD